MSTCSGGWVTDLYTSPMLPNHTAAGSSTMTSCLRMAPAGTLAFTRPFSAESSAGRALRPWASATARLCGGSGTMRSSAESGGARCGLNLASR
jgi:hypothetical protein